MPRLAITGGTGFVGAHVLQHAIAAGHSVRALARRPQAALAGVEWVLGDLSDAAALDALTHGQDTILHIAGVINARDEAGFVTGNIAGTAAVLAAAQRAGVRRFVAVSSLAAREPGLSRYGASKAQAEALVRESGLDWTIIRPPGVYGPGDRETLALFQMVRLGVALLPADGRASMIEVGDLARALLAVASDTVLSIRKSYEISDGIPATQAELATAIGVALGRKPRLLTLPRPLLHLAAAADTGWARLRGTLPRLSFDRARYLAHPDWTAQGDNLSALWHPMVPLAAGLKITADWYRENGWIRP